MTEHVLVSPLESAPGAVSGVYFALAEYRDLTVDKVITVILAPQLTSISFCLTIHSSR